MLDNHEEEIHEEEGAACLSEKNLPDHAAVILTGMAWADLGDDIVARVWNLLSFLCFPAKSTRSHNKSEGGSRRLRNNDNERKSEVLHPVGLPLLEKHSKSYCWIKMATTYSAKDLH